MAKEDLPQVPIQEILANEPTRQANPLILDVDGVVTNKDIYSFMATALKDNKQVVINTLRPYSAEFEVMEQLRDLLANQAGLSCMIVENGAAMVKKGEERIELVRDKERLEAAKKEIDVMCKRTGTITQEVGEGMYRFNMNGERFLYGAPPDVTVAYLVGESEESVERLRQRVVTELPAIAQTNAVGIQRTHERSLIVTDPACTKGSALLYAMKNIPELSQLGLSNALCIGDGKLDIPMFQAVQKQGGTAVNLGNFSF